jgi:toxin ParE1/3/4
MVSTGCANMRPAAGPRLTYSVVIGPRALDDLEAIFDWIAGQAGFDVADGYVTRIESACGGLRDFAHRGAPRDDLVPGLRTLAFERRTTIAYTVVGRTVTIRRVLYGGRDIERAFEET